MKTALIILSDPKSGTEEALGRLFNAMAATYDFKQRGEDVELYFQGAGTRWVGEIAKAEHPAHTLYNAIRDRIAGISCGCADAFGARETANASGFDLITANPVPGTSGLLSVADLIGRGYRVITF